MVKRSFDQNAFDTDVLKRDVLVSVLLAISVFAVIYSSLLICNFTAFDEVAIKSNKYNPNFREERSFPTSLSGDFFVGLDRLFTDFLNREVVFDWSEDKENNAPSVFVASPVLLLSLIGFYYLLRSSRDEAILFLMLILTEVGIVIFTKPFLLGTSRPFCRFYSCP